jgi:hypothetical protein
MKKSTVRIPTSGRKLNWHKDDQRKIRRQKALNSRHGSLIQTAHALHGLANKSTDPETVRKAKADSTFFFAQHKKRIELKSKKTTRRR